MTYSLKKLCWLYLNVYCFLQHHAIIKLTVYAVHGADIQLYVCCCLWFCNQMSYSMGFLNLSWRSPSPAQHCTRTSQFEGSFEGSLWFRILHSACFEECIICVFHLILSSRVLFRLSNSQKRICWKLISTELIQFCYEKQDKKYFEDDGIMFYFILL